MLENVINDETRTQRLMVTSFDGRARTGRLFHVDDEQGYTFELGPNIDFKTFKVIADCAYAYALRRRGSLDENL